MNNTVSKHEASSCIRKTGYSRAEALKQACKLQQNEKAKPGIVIDAYSCKYCGMWHMGHRKL